MTDLLQRALAELAKRPPDEQNAIAIIILSMLSEDDETPAGSSGPSMPDIGWLF